MAVLSGSLGYVHIRINIGDQNTYERIHCSREKIVLGLMFMFIMFFLAHFNISWYFLIGCPVEVFYVLSFWWIWWLSWQVFRDFHAPHKQGLSVRGVDLLTAYCEAVMDRTRKSYTVGHVYWLVVWNMTFISPFSWEFHHPN